MLESNRTVVAAVRDEGKARDVLPSSERLLVRSGVDVTDPSTFSDDLWEGVTQVVSAVGPTFSRTEQGPKYALSLVYQHAHARPELVLDSMWLLASVLVSNDVQPVVQTLCA